MPNKPNLPSCPTCPITQPAQPAQVPNLPSCSMPNCPTCPTCPVTQPAQLLNAQLPNLPSSPTCPTCPTIRFLSCYGKPRTFFEPKNVWNTFLPKKCLWSCPAMTWTMFEVVIAWEYSNKGGSEIPPPEVWESQKLNEVTTGSYPFKVWE